MEHNGLPKAYEAGQYESGIYAAWIASGFFNPDNLPKQLPDGSRRKKKRFSIVMPPPNTTGLLHVGHVSGIAYQDLMIRFKRLCGYETLYVPGTDHAAIATQNKVEKLIAQEGLTRQSLGREKFLSRVRAYVTETQGQMKAQIRATGASCDWSREAYTFDDVSTRVVNEVFISMYRDGLIYRGNRIVNWCTRCQSTLADDEVEYVEEQTPFYYLKYGPVIIGTARPETKFQDKVIIVHPDDTRYSHLVGTSFDVPWIEGTVKATVIADVAADPALGTGAMTITPAHSFEDFALAQKYGLDVVQIIDTDGKLTEAAGSMKGMTVVEARKAVVAKLQEKGLVDHIDNEYKHNLSVCYRCGTPVEPLISKQWFLDVNKKLPNQRKSLKQLATDIVRRREVAILPERFRKTYFHWLNNLHDWCISRQIWWGHRIPVWYSPCGEVVASAAKPAKACPKCKSKDYHQDEDTLDTWFSSATWTFSTLLTRDHSKFHDLKHWARKSKDLQKFHPTSVLETGYDILFFWVARMILVTSYIMHEKPFSAVYLHGMVRDKEGRKMSKSLNNGIDPLDVIVKYGADALRLSLIIGAAPGMDVRVYDEKIAGYRNFVNKLWNIARFVMQSVDRVESVAKKPKAQTLADQWILSRFESMVATVTKSIEKYEFSSAGEALYAFTWQDFADWYVEIAKIEGAASPTAKKNKDAILLYILERLLIVWHPFAPFITEVLWKEFNASYPIMIHAWPTVKKLRKKNDVSEFEQLQAMITAIRMLRADNKIPAADITPVRITGATHLQAQQAVIERLGRARFDESLTGGTEVKGSGFTIMAQVTIPMTDKKREELKAYITSLEAKLANDQFTKNAPGQVIDQERKKLAEAKNRLAA